MSAFLFTVAVSFSCLLCILLKNFFSLYEFPGPILSKFSNIWRYLDVRKGSHEATLICLHRRHGIVVRTGPNSLSIGTPEAIPKIYGVGRGFTKVWGILFGLQIGLFTLNVPEMRSETN